MPDANQILWLFLLSVLVVGAVWAGFYLVIAVRRWAQKDERVTTFTLQDLREMRTRGDITESEFAAMRATLLAEVNSEFAHESAPASEDAALDDDSGGR